MKHVAQQTANDADKAQQERLASSAQEAQAEVSAWVTPGEYGRPFDDVPRDVEPAHT